MSSNKKAPQFLKEKRRCLAQPYGRQVCRHSTSFPVTTMDGSAGSSTTGVSTGAGTAGSATGGVSTGVGTAGSMTGGTSSMNSRTQTVPGFSTTMPPYSPSFWASASSTRRSRQLARRSSGTWIKKGCTPFFHPRTRPIRPSSFLVSGIFHDRRSQRLTGVQSIFAPSRMTVITPDALVSTVFTVLTAGAEVTAGASFTTLTVMFERAATGEVELSVFDVKVGSLPVFPTFHRTFAPA